MLDLIQDFVAGDRENWRNGECSSGGNSESFLEANFRRIKMKNKIAQKCVQLV
jgi:hypothetical protein